MQRPAREPQGLASGWPGPNRRRHEIQSKMGELSCSVRRGRTREPAWQCGGGSRSPPQLHPNALHTGAAALARWHPLPCVDPILCSLSLRSAPLPLAHLLSPPIRFFRDNTMSGQPHHWKNLVFCSADGPTDPRSLSRSLVDGQTSPVAGEGWSVAVTLHERGARDPDGIHWLSTVH